MIRYCQNDIDCRKQQIALYLGETIKYDCREIANRGEICNPCDNCRRQMNIQRQYYDLSSYLTLLQNRLTISRRFDSVDLVKQLASIVPFTNEEIYRLINHLIIEGSLRLKVVIENHRLNEFYEVVKPVTQLLLETGKSRDIVHPLHRRSRRSVGLSDRSPGRLLSITESPRSEGSIHKESSSCKDFL